MNKIVLHLCHSHFQLVFSWGKVYWRAVKEGILKWSYTKLFFGFSCKTRNLIFNVRYFLPRFLLIYKFLYSFLGNDNLGKLFMCPILFINRFQLFMGASPPSPPPQKKINSINFMALDKNVLGGQFKSQLILIGHVINCMICLLVYKSN